MNYKQVALECGISERVNFSKPLGKGLRTVVFACDDLASVAKFCTSAGFYTTVPHVMAAQENSALLAGGIGDKYNGMTMFHPNSNVNVWVGIGRRINGPAVGPDNIFKTDVRDQVVEILRTNERVFWPRRMSIELFGVRSIRQVLAGRNLTEVIFDNLWLDERKVVLIDDDLFRLKYRPVRNLLALMVVSVANKKALRELTK